MDSVASISSRNLVDAVQRVERMGFAERERLAEEVHTQQPNLFYSVLVLQRYGATLVQIEVVLNILLVFHEAMKFSGSTWPVISEDVQERCLTRISGRVRFIEGLSPQLQAKTIADAVGNHPEQPLLVYVFEKFKESDLLGIKTEPEKMLMLAALNLVECIAEAAPRRPESWDSFLALDETTAVPADFMTEADRNQGEHASRDPLGDAASQ